MRERASVPTANNRCLCRRATAVAALLLVSSVFASDIDDFEKYGVILTHEKYRGNEAIKVAEAKSDGGTADTIAVLKGALFHNGTIDVWLAGAPRDAAVAAGGARGFVGIAFRVTDPSHYEAFYLRPTNGRAEDQLRRNHSTQYVSHPEYPWERLRSETPGEYESYADMAPGEWIHCRIVVAGTKAQLFLGASNQPSLIINDLKHGDLSGGVALWIGPGTVARFFNLQISP